MKQLIKLVDEKVDNNNLLFKKYLPVEATKKYSQSI
jgi:hypothetical protein